MIAMRDLTVRYGSTVAVDALTLDLAPGKIYGLLGRNGSGKTSLLNTIAAYRKASSGTITVGGADPFENPAVMRDTVLVRDFGSNEGERARSLLDLHARLRPRFDAERAGQLAAAFELDLDKRIKALSHGQRSALGVVIGLASRAPLTLLDEAYLGMDAAARQLFKRELLADYLEQPRTIILSTHLIEEVADLFEEVVVIDRGRLVLHEDTDALRARGVAVTGAADAVAAFVAGRTVLAERSLGATRQVTLYGALDDGERRAAERAGLTLAPVGIQDLFVHLTAPQQRIPEAVR